MLFIDGTDIYVERPGGANKYQRSLFSGHHRQHAILYLVGATTNGIIATLDGPFPGSCNDAGAYAQAGVENRLRRLLAPANAGLPVGHRICAAADGGFPISDVLQTRIVAPVLTPAQILYNTALSSVRESIEWVIGKVFTLWEYINWCVPPLFCSSKLPNTFFRYMCLSVGRSPVGIVCEIAFFLTNCHVCFNGSESSSFFGIDPPTIEEYLY
jgi:hypothetical protein